jgi:transposase
MVYRFISERKNQYTIREMAGVFGVSSSAYYKWAKQGVSERRKERDAELVGFIREIMIRYDWQYGSPRVREALRKDYGQWVSLKKVARLMQENGLNARRREKHNPR